MDLSVTDETVTAVTAGKSLLPPATVASLPVGRASRWAKSCGTRSCTALSCGARSWLAAQQNAAWGGVALWLVQGIGWVLRRRHFALRVAVARLDGTDARLLAPFSRFRPA